ncbi:hypothetical protein F4777DRAFT_595861 [Nemania sp. FL0916]|nr:hypothetical protein F4777DRAFT_595861 [Nemania sp. FL0916]
MAPENNSLPLDSDMVAPTVPPAGSSDVGDRNSTDNVLKKEESWGIQRKKITLTVDVEWLDFEHFKNRYTEKEGLAIIEVLIGNSQIAQEVSRETAKRARGKKDVRLPIPNPELAVDGDWNWMQRVRIQSPQLILLLSRLTGHRDKWLTGKPRTFFAPFRCFYHYLTQLKHCVKLLEAHWPAGEASISATLPNRGSDSDEDEVADTGPIVPELAVSGDLVNSRVTLVHLTRFVGFIETHIVPLWHRAAGTDERKFRFSDVLMAFQCGELLQTPLSNDDEGRSTKMYQTMWRFITAECDTITEERPEDTQKTSNRELDIHAYYVDYDGISYVPVRHVFHIKHFEGEKDITTLKVYPLRFNKDMEGIKNTLHNRGSWFRRAITEKQVSCDGWTLVHGPTGSSPDSQGSLSVEHVEGEVIIDFVEGYKSESSLSSIGPSTWKQLETLIYPLNWGEGEDYTEILHWKPLANNHRLEKFAEIDEKIQRSEYNR